jgi:Family of unknown function (DUF6111)
MVRVIVENVLLFLLPTAIYMGYVFLLRKTNASANQVLNEAPLIWLFFAGLATIFVTVVIFGAKHEGSPDQAYEPPSYKDGKIVPGRVK